MVCLASIGSLISYREGAVNIIPLEPEIYYLWRCKYNERTGRFTLLIRRGRYTTKEGRREVYN